GEAVFGWRRCWDLADYRRPRALLSRSWREWIVVIVERTSHDERLCAHHTAIGDPWNFLVNLFDAIASQDDQFKPFYLVVLGLDRHMLQSQCLRTERIQSPEK